MKTSRRLVATLALMCGVAAQAHPDGERPAPRERCQAETTGRVIGGIAGALIGRQLGDDRAGRAIGTVGGALVGGAIGGEIGRRIDADDPACSLPPPPASRGRTAAPLGN